MNILAKLLKPILDVVPIEPIEPIDPSSLPTSTTNPTPQVPELITTALPMWQIILFAGIAVVLVVGAVVIILSALRSKKK